MVLRGGSAKIIICGAKTSDPLSFVRGSYENRRFSGGVQKTLSRFYHRKPTNAAFEVEKPCSEGCLGRWFLADFRRIFNFKRGVCGVPMIESTRCFLYASAETSTFI